MTTEPSPSPTTIPKGATTTTLHHLVERRFVGVTPDAMRVMVDGSPGVKTGMGPMQLVLNALAACAAFEVVEMIEKRRLAIRSYRIEVTGERREHAPRSFVRIHTRHLLDVPGLERAMAERFVDLALSKYCSVASSLSALKTFEVVLEGADG